MHDGYGLAPETAIDMVNDSTNLITTQLRYHMYSLRLNSYFRPGIPLDKGVTTIRHGKFARNQNIRSVQHLKLCL